MMNCLDINQLRSDLNMEQIEIDLEEAKMLAHAGFMNKDHYLEHRHHVIGGLLKLGSTFSVALGHTLSVADIPNSLKILRYWAHLCEQHALLYKMYLAREKALSSVEL